MQLISSEIIATRIVNRDNGHRTTDGRHEAPYYELCWHIQAELKIKKTWGFKRLELLRTCCHQLDNNDHLFPPCTCRGIFLLCMWVQAKVNSSPTSWSGINRRDVCYTTNSPRCRNGSCRRTDLPGQLCVEISSKHRIHKSKTLHKPQEWTVRYETFSPSSCLYVTAYSTERKLER